MNTEKKTKEEVANLVALKTEGLGKNELTNVTNLGEIFVKSGFFADTKQASQAIVKVLAGKELGFPPVASMTGVYIVKGKVALSANLMAAAIKKSGRYNFQVKEVSNQKCSIEFLENGQVIGKSEFSIEDAKQAKLDTGTNWTQYPRNMLYARAMSNGAKWYCPDIFSGPVYTPDELGAEVNEDGEVVNLDEVEEIPLPEDKISEKDRRGLFAEANKYGIDHADIKKLIKENFNTDSTKNLTYIQRDWLLSKFKEIDRKIDDEATEAALREI